MMNIAKDFLIIIGLFSLIFGAMCLVTDQEPTEAQLEKQVLDQMIIDANKQHKEIEHELKVQQIYFDELLFKGVRHGKDK